MLRKIAEKQGWRRFRPAAWVQVTGEDALVFLQGQFTQDLVATPDGGVAYGLWLTPKGRVWGDSFVLKASPTQLWVMSEGLTGVALRERLEAYVVADDVVIEDASAQAHALVMAGLDDPSGTTPGVTRSEAVPPSLARLEPGRWHREGDLVAFRGLGSRAALGFLVTTGPAEALPRPGGVEWTQDEALRTRIARGWVRVPDDVGPGEFPNEGGLETEAISYTKGCYLGQETVARLKAFGQSRRGIRRVVGPSGLPPPSGSPLFQGAKRVGELRTAVADGEGGFVGFALLTHAAWEPTIGLSTTELGPAHLQVIP